MKDSSFASRAGEKLDFALHQFALDIHGFVCADFGSSTGGFVDVLLQRGAVKVFAVETGYGVLDWKLRNNPRVSVMERTNAMHVTLDEKVDLITNDTSWTKQEIIFSNILKNLKEHGLILTLLKPHYEANPKLLVKGVLDEKLAEEVSTDVTLRLTKLFPVKLLQLTKSPLLGRKGGNTEYLALLEKI